MNTSDTYFKDRNSRFSNARQNVRYYQIFTGYFKNLSDIMKLTPTV